ncbi:copper-binding protein [Sorangium sp. So ce1182]|uniref:copper-binding protein n=1 Tax=Sorangium sp. So ce1182 TaxID=3133334 RepID=UPI003F605829
MPHEVLSSTSPGSTPAGAEAPVRVRGRLRPVQIWLCVSALTTGAVRSLGPGRAYANIAHDDIPGYMSAMTMSFEPQSPALLDGIEVGDRIAFDFVETEDARRVLTRVEKHR